jgi:hypothetical protein
MERSTMKTSDVIRALQHYIDRYGDLPAYFSDGFFRYGLTCHTESAPNYDSPRAILFKAFNLDTGINGPNKPLDF